MNVFVLGGTGSIGMALVRSLLSRGHAVLALGRSASSERCLAELGAEPLHGDIRSPHLWVDRIPPTIDAVVHAAATFDDDMAAVDRNLTSCLISRLRKNDRVPTLVYTGGCWLYGDTKGRLVDETAPLKPPDEWRWMAEHLQEVLAAPGIRGVGVHPAMVWSNAGGVLKRFIDDARHLREVRVVGGEGVHWPLVHRDDLAELYARVLEGGRRGETYNGASIARMTVGAIARGLARRLGCTNETPRIVHVDAFVAQAGPWMRGYILDQGMDSSKARRELGWQPRFLDVFAGVP